LSYPSFPPNGSFIGDTPFNGNTAFTFTSTFIEENAVKPTRGRKPGPKPKVKTETTPGQLVFENNPGPPSAEPRSAESASTVAIYGDGVPSHMTQEIQLQLPNVGKPKGRGRGRGRATDTYLDPPEPPKLGKGRAGTQGVVVQITHQGREDALAEQARKRRRVDAEEDLDMSEEHILQGLLTNEEVKDLPLKRRKTEPKTKRDHHACDRCFRNKTKVAFHLSFSYNSNYFSVIVKLMGNHLAEVSLAIIAPTLTAFALLRLRTPRSRSRTPLLKRLNGRLGSSKRS
jgi:hypothetical protein